MRPIPIALVHERAIRLDLLDDEVVFGAEAVIIDSIPGVESLPFGVH
jgi:hypothetical protein